MKRTILLLAIISLNIFVIGAVLKMLYSPGADEFVALGLGLFSVGFLPIAGYHIYQADKKNYGTLIIIGFACLFVMIMGAIFKINHYPGAAKLLYTGIALPFMVFLPVMMYYHVKKERISLLSFLSIMFLMMYIVVFSALLSVAVHAPAVTN